jgi:hypothetical protein
MGMNRILRFAVVVLLVCLSVGSAFGADAPVKPLPATEKYEAAAGTAEQAFEKSLLVSIRTAQLACDRATLAAKQAYSRELQQQLTTATKAGKLDDANAASELKKMVDAEIKSLQDNLAEAQSRDVSLPPTPAEQAFADVLRTAINDARQAGDKARADAPGTSPKRFKIAAAEPWQKTVTVKKGDRLKIVATGNWCLRTTTRTHTTCGPAGIVNSAFTGIRHDAAVGALLGRIGSSGFVIGPGTELTAPQDGDLEMQSNDPKITDNDGELTVTITAK